MGTDAVPTPTQLEVAAVWGFLFKEYEPRAYYWCV
jgi:hypothetical protein